MACSNRCHFVLLDKDESCPTADLSNIRPSQWSGLFDRSAVEHAPCLVGAVDEIESSLDVVCSQEMDCCVIYVVVLLMCSSSLP